MKELDKQIHDLEVKINQAANELEKASAKTNKKKKSKLESKINKLSDELYQKVAEKIYMIGDVKTAGKLIRKYKNLAQGNKKRLAQIEQILVPALNELKKKTEEREIKTPDYSNMPTDLLGKVKEGLSSKDTEDMPAKERQAIQNSTASAQTELDKRQDKKDAPKDIDKKYAVVNNGDKIYIIGNITDEEALNLQSECVNEALKNNDVEMYVCNGLKEGLNTIDGNVKVYMDKDGNIMLKDTEVFERHNMDPMKQMSAEEFYQAMKELNPKAHIEFENGMIYLNREEELFFPNGYSCDTDKKGGKLYVTDLGARNGEKFFEIREIKDDRGLDILPSGPVKGETTVEEPVQDQNETPEMPDLIDPIAEGMIKFPSKRHKVSRRPNEKLREIWAKHSNKIKGGVIIAAITAVLSGGVAAVNSNNYSPEQIRQTDTIGQSVDYNYSDTQSIEDQTSTFDNLTGTANTISYTPVNTVDTLDANNLDVQANMQNTYSQTIETASSSFKDYMTQRNADGGEIVYLDAYSAVKGENGKPALPSFEWNVRRVLDTRTGQDLNVSSLADLKNYVNSEEDLNSIAIAFGPEDKTQEADGWLSAERCIELFVQMQMSADNMYGSMEQGGKTR